MELTFTYIERAFVSNSIKDELDSTVLGIFLTSYNDCEYYIISKDGFFEFNDGYNITATKDFRVAIQLLEQFIVENYYS